MKSIINISQRSAVFKIEAARYSYLIYMNAKIALDAELRNMEGLVNVEGATRATGHAWQMIDMAFRFGCLINRISGLRHKDPRHQLYMSLNKTIENLRNYIQHLSNQFGDNTGCIYPVLGALCWSSETGDVAHTVTLGTLPLGTFFHTLAYKRDIDRFMPQILLMVDKYNIDLEEVSRKIKSAHDYLDEWLEQNNHLSEEGLQQTHLWVNKNEIKKEGVQKYVRLEITISQADAEALKAGLSQGAPSEGQQGSENPPSDLRAPGNLPHLQPPAKPDGKLYE